MQPDAPEVGRQVRQTDGLDYPFKMPPPSGQAVQIAPGLLWLRQPLPFALDHINVWALEDDGAWTVVDTGMHSEASITAWNSAFAGVLAGRPINRVIGTHMHPDHIGLAGWLKERFNARLWMSRTEYLNCRMLIADTGRDAPADAICFYRAAGWDEAAINDYKSRFGSFGRRIYRLPDSFRRLEDGEEIRIGARRWRIIVGRGHSPEHVCLHCPDGKLLISGDQVLPRISSNVSVHPTEPDADPLGEWLQSLELIKQRVSDDVLVLPAHNLPFRGLHARLDRITGDHERSLQGLHQLLAKPKRAIDVFGALFRRPVDGSLLSLATGESVAHLNCLLRRGRASYRDDEHGVRWYLAG